MDGEVLRDDAAESTRLGGQAKASSKLESPGDGIRDRTHSRFAHRAMTVRGGAATKEVNFQVSQPSLC